MKYKNLNTSDDVEYYFMARDVKRSIYDWAQECVVADGYGFFHPSFFRKVGVPDRFVEYVTKIHKSNYLDMFALFNGVIYGKDDQPMDEVIAVNNMEFLTEICKALDLPVKTGAWGRNKQAKILVKRIEDYMNNTQMYCDNCDAPAVVKEHGLFLCEKCTAEATIKSKYL